MAKYKRRPKVKRYRRSFYSRGMRIRKIVGIVVLVAVVLAAAWFAAPHVLDWATHTWYTVVKDRDLEAESASRAAASSQAAASAAASEAASSAASEPEEDVFNGKAIVSGRWAELDTAALTDDGTLRATAQQLKAQGVEYAVLTLKDAAGNIYYASQAAAAAGGIVAEPLDAGHIAAILREEKLIPVAQLAAFKDPISPRTDPSMAIHYNGSALWLDAQKNGNPWLNPYSTAAVEYVGDLVEEVQQLGFEQVVLTGVQFPNIITRKQEFAAAGGKSQEGRAALLAADISTWQARFDGSVVLWLSYPAQQCTDASDALGAPAVSLGMHNLIVTADTLDAAVRGQLQQSAAEAGVQNVVICSTESFQ